VVDLLRALGFEAAVLEGGIEAWKAAGGPLVRSDQAR
jgi:rhodanese-related sulfurtransferase